MCMYVVLLLEEIKILDHNTIPTCAMVFNFCIFFHQCRGKNFMDAATALQAPEDVVSGFIIGKLKVLCCRASICV